MGEITICQPQVRSRVDCYFQKVKRRHWLRSPSGWDGKPWKNWRLSRSRKRYWPGTYYVLFFIHLESRRVSLAGMAPYPGQEWMEQQARNATMEEWGFLRGCRYLLHDRDTKFCASFRELIKSGSVKVIRLPARSPNLNSFAERWVSCRS
jgi:hypothetical protein